MNPGTENTHPITIRIKRVYDEPAADDGCRVLVDRLWPRGVAKERARLDEWLGDVAPTPELRTWWKHDPDRLDEFARRYTAELDALPSAMRAVGLLRALAERNARSGIPTTLVYGAKDPRVNHARVLAGYLAAHLAADPEIPPGTPSAR